MAPIASSAKAISKRVNVYIRRHPFVFDSTRGFTTSQRRAFLRNVYDYARALGLGKKEAKQQVVKAREMCGEDAYDTDDTALENENDDSEAILFKLEPPDVSRSESIISAAQTPIPMAETVSATRHEVISISDDVTTMPLKRKKPMMAANRATSRSLQTAPEMTATDGVTKHKPIGRPPKRRIESNFDFPQGEGRKPQLRGKASTLPQQTFTGPDEERELVPRTKRVPTRIMAGIRQDSDMPDAKTEKKQMTSHLNAVMMKSTSLPATSTNVTIAAQNFVDPEVAAFSDDDQDMA